MKKLLPLLLLALAHTDNAWSESEARIVPKATEAMITALTGSGDRLYAVGERGHVFEGAGDLRQLPFPLRTQLNDVAEVNGKLWVVGWDSLIAHRASSTASWQIQHREPALESPLFSCAFSDADHGIAVGAFGLILVTQNGGSSWERVRPIESDTHFYKAAMDSAGHWMVCGELGTVLKLSQKGELITQYDTGFDYTYFGIEPIGPESFLIYGLLGRILLYKDSKFSMLETTRHGTIFGSTKKGNTLFLCGVDGTVWIVKGDKMRCHDLGERIALTSACIQGDTLVLGSTSGFRRIPLSELAEAE